MVLAFPPLKPTCSRFPGILITSVVIEEERDSSFSADGEADGRLTTSQKMPCTCGARDLFDAAKKGCDKCCRAFIDQARKTRDDIDLGWWGTSKNRTALMVAAYYGNAECVRVLAEKEARKQDRLKKPP